MTVPFDRSGLIVNAWWYGPSWHFGRLVTTLATILLSEMISAPYMTFVWFVAVQSVFLTLSTAVQAIFSLKKHQVLEQAIMTGRSGQQLAGDITKLQL